MNLNATERVVVNEVMKEWRAYVKPSKGVLVNNPQDEFGDYYTYEVYALEWVDAIIAKNNYEEILYTEEVSNIKEEVKNRVAKAVKKDEEGFKALIEEIESRR